MNKEIGNRIVRFFYLNLKKWDEIRFEGVFLLRDTFRAYSESRGEKMDPIKDTHISFYEGIHKNKQTNNGVVSYFKNDSSL